MAPALHAVATPPEGNEAVQVPGITGDPKAVHAVAERAARAAEATIARLDRYEERADQRADRIEQRQNAQENLHAQRHRALLAILGRIEGKVDRATGKASVALAVAEDARASRPDDGRLDALAADVIEADLERKRAETAAEAERRRSETQLNEARAHESIRARAEKRAAVIKIVVFLIAGGGLGQLAGWLFKLLFGGG